jgi:lactoylglutathione lyase
MKIHHIAIWVEDLEKVKDFYLQNFDCKVNEPYFNPQRQFRSYFVKFGDETAIEVMSMPQIEMTDKTSRLSGYAHIALALPSKSAVDEKTAQLQANGVKIIGQPRITGDGYYESVIADPEGNQIELVFAG